MTAAPEPPPSGPPIWIVNADHWPRAYLRAELLERGYDAIGFETLEDALARLALARALRPALLLLDLDGQIVDDRQRLALANARVPILAVTGAGAAQAPPGPLAGTLRRPLTIGAIADAVDRATGRAASARPSI
jgi:FixJ family two-component response regulator